MSTMVAARFPDKVNRLVLASSPIDTDAGNGPIRELATPAGVLLRGSGENGQWPDGRPFHAAGAGRPCILTNSMCRSISSSTST